MYTHIFFQIHSFICGGVRVGNAGFINAKTRKPTCVSHAQRDYESELFVGTSKYIIFRLEFNLITKVTQFGRKNSLFASCQDKYDILVCQLYWWTKQSLREISGVIPSILFSWSTEQIPMKDPWHKSRYFSDTFVENEEYFPPSWNNPKKISANLFILRRVCFCLLLTYSPGIITLIFILEDNNVSVY